MAARLLLSRSSGSAPRTLLSRGIGTLRPLDHGALRPSDPRPTATPTPDLPAPKAPAIPRLLGSPKIWNCDHTSCHLFKLSPPSLQYFPRWFSVETQGGAMEHEASKVCTDISTEKDFLQNMGVKPEHSKIVLFSPLEVTLKARPSGLRTESLKIKKIELSQKITYALIPALLLITKTKLTTSAILLSVFWQIHGFFKEIFLDYIHQEVTREWVSIYFKLLLLIVAKDAFLNFDLL